ncbi:MAG: tripartite tricarboxylate transporter permease [Deltaproteobacteria bacterium]|jgi:putative tricarboxylic transport membrane protein|nr:tripartite tricarboxylate transporter permease [Deltaproteobacteria bacterium]
MDLLHNLYLGFSILLDNPLAIMYAIVGVLAGVIIGALPGLGPSMGIAVLLPLTYGMQPVTGIIMLAGVYYGAMYGGSISAVLINTPGDSAAVMTTLDGYPLAVQGQAGKALGIAAYASVIGGTVCVVVFMLVAPIIANFAVAFGPAEYFSLMILGLTSIAGMTGKSPVKGFLSAFLGLFVATIGLDLVTGGQRYTLGAIQLFEGIDFIPVAMGLFGIAEIITVKNASSDINVDQSSIKIKNLFPNKQEWKYCAPHIFRGTILGFIIGLLPGAGATIAAFLSYDLAKRTSKRSDLFGKGAIEGVAAPECANNAASMGAMVPMFTLGIPGSGATAVMMGALMMFGLTPGPAFFRNNADFAWGLIASMYVGNVCLLILGILGLPIFIKVLKVKAPILNAVVMGFILIGSYSLNNSLFNVGLTIFFGALGYVMKKLEIPAAPMVLAIVLGAMTEKSLRQAMMLADGNIGTMLGKPIVIVVLLLALGLAFGTPIINAIKRARKSSSAKKADRQSDVARA